MNVNLASANMAQQYANNTMQATAQPLKTSDESQQSVQATQTLQSVPTEPSKEARPVQQAADTSMGRSVDVYI